MAYPVFVSPPSSDHFPDAIKYVEYNGQELAKSEYVKSENSFILRYLASGPDHDILDKLMIVKFNDSIREEEIKEILLDKGIECQGSRYYFLGHSDVQLKNKTCYVMCSTQEEIQAVYSKLTDFSRRISVADRTSEIGTLFCDYKFNLELKEGEFDFTNADPHHCDSTGICGFMSMKLSEQIQEQGLLSHAPSVVRIIHENCNGLLLRSDMKGPVKVRVLNSTKPRQNIRRAQSTPQSIPPRRNLLGIRDIEMPYTIGYLDAQAVMLLADKGVPDRYMATLQKKYYDILDRLEDDSTLALYFLKLTGREDLRRKLQETGLTEEIKGQLKVIKEEENRKMPSSQNCLRVLVPRAREVLGVPDPYSPWPEIHFICGRK